jgi:uncharacterized damage-inducible protein DinB
MRYTPMAVAALLMSSLMFVSVRPLEAQAPTDPLSAGQKLLYSMIKNNLIRSAEKMPEENYAFKPVPEVMSFGEMLGHIVDTQNRYMSIALGEANPMPDAGKSKTTKAGLIQALKDSFAYADKVYDAMTDAQGVQIVQFYGRPQAKLTVLAFNNAHNDEHYGNIVTYLRIKGLVPPSSEPRK